MSIELIKQLRSITNAGMADCKSALQEANNDLNAAIDIIRVKGQAISDSRSAKVATEGRIAICHPFDDLASIIEINSNTDFTSNSEIFIKFATLVADRVAEKSNIGEEFLVANVEAKRQQVVSATKENIVIRRWSGQYWPKARVFSYLHSSAKIGVLLAMHTEEAYINNANFVSLGNDLTMQICAMNPIAIASDQLSEKEIKHQRGLFEAQLREGDKPIPEVRWPQIIEGKFAKWYKEACLLEQESVIVPKTSIQQVIKSVEAKIGSSITLLNFVRYEVGQGLEKPTTDLAEEVSKLL